MLLFSKEQGQAEKPALVFLHGFLGNSDDWTNTIKHLKDNYYCICIDLPGHGRSTACIPPLQDGFAYCHRLIKSTLNALQVKQYTLIGYSLGGRIALDYARTQADTHLQHLILESCHSGLSTAQDKNKRYQQDLNWAKRFTSQSIPQSLAQWYEQAVFSDLSSAQKGLVIKQRSQNDGACVAQMLLATSLCKQTDALPFLQSNNAIKLPIYYAVGEKDRKFKALAGKLAEQTKIKVNKFNGAGHNIHQQYPLQYAQFIKQCIST